MREIVHLQTGQCGNQIGAKVSFYRKILSGNCFRSFNCTCLNNRSFKISCREEFVKVIGIVCTCTYDEIIGERNEIHSLLYGWATKMLSATESQIIVQGVSRNKENPSTWNKLRCHRQGKRCILCNNAKQVPNLNTFLCDILWIFMLKWLVFRSFKLTPKGKSIKQ